MMKIGSGITRFGSAPSLVFSDRFNRFRTRFGHDDNWATFETKGAPQLVDKILSIRSRKQIVPIDEKEKGWRGLFDLCGIKEFEAVSAHSDGLPPLDRVLQGSIQQRRWDFLAKLGRDEPDCLEQTFQVKT